MLAAALLSASVAAAAAAPLVAVDAGHTSAAPGATSARGIPERTFNLAVAERLVAALRGDGLRAVLVGGGADAPPGARPALAARLGAAMLVSIHHDSVQPRYLTSWTVDGVERTYSDRFRGFSVFYSGAGARPRESLRLAIRIGDALLALGLAPTLHHAEPIEGEGRPLVDARRGACGPRRVRRPREPRRGARAPRSGAAGADGPSARAGDRLGAPLAAMTFLRAADRE